MPTRKNTIVIHFLSPNLCFCNHTHESDPLSPLPSHSVSVVVCCISSIQFFRIDPLHNRIVAAASPVRRDRGRRGFPFRESQVALCNKMSGSSFGVAPRLNSTEEERRETARQIKRHGVMGVMMGSLRVIELQLVAFILVFSASGLVSLLDLVFPVFISLYLLGLSRWVFPSYRKPGREPRVHQGSRMFQLYAMIGTAVGLFLPLAYVLGGFARGDRYAVRSATPHLFLLSFQILSENIINGLSLFSPPVRALVPLLYTVRRVFAIIDWNYSTFSNAKLPETGRFQDMAWMWFGRGLAAANAVYFTINLFCFLIPRFLPRAFETYFRERTEYEAKSAQDKPVKVQRKLY